MVVIVARRGPGGGGDSLSGAGRGLPAFMFFGRFPQGMAPMQTPSVGKQSIIHVMQTDAVQIRSDVPLKCYSPTYAAS
jgi:hypothetical protein